MKIIEPVQMKSFGIRFDSENQEARVAFSYDDNGNNLARFICDVINETVRARKKFPSSNLSMCALTEEVGELAKAYLSEPKDAIYKEAIQVATMAGRVCIEGDPSIEIYRTENDI